MQNENWSSQHNKTILNENKAVNNLKQKQKTI